MNYSMMYAVLSIAAAAAPVGAADRWIATYKAGLDLFEHGEYTRARGILLDALLEAQARKPVDWQLPATLHTLGITEQALGQYRESRGHLEAAVDLWPRTGDNGKQSSITLESLGSLLSDAGEWDAASREFLAALSLKEQIYGVSSIEVASTLAKVAESCISRGQLRRALPLLDRALEMQTHLLPAADPAVLTTRIMLAHVLRGLGYFEAARLHASTAETAGRQSSLYPEILAVLGDVYRREGNPARGVPLLRQAITLAAAFGTGVAGGCAEPGVHRPGGRKAGGGPQRFRTRADDDPTLMGTRPSGGGIGPNRPGGGDARGAKAGGGFGAPRGRPPADRERIPGGSPVSGLELILRAALAQAHGDHGSARDAIRSAWAQSNGRSRGIKKSCGESLPSVMRPYRPDLAREAAKRNKALRRGFPGEKTTSEFENQRGN